MNDVLIQQVNEDLELYDLERNWNAECKCTSTHLPSNHGTPSGACAIWARWSVTLTCIGVNALWCDSRYEAFISQAGSMGCIHCGNQQIDCWKVVAL